MKITLIIKKVIHEELCKILTMKIDGIGMDRNCF